MTPPSPLGLSPEAVRDIQQAMKIEEGIKQLRQACEKAVSNPELSPRSHDNANEDPQTDEVTHEIIGPSPTPEARPRRKQKKMTKIVYNRSPTKTQREVWSPWMQGKALKNIKDRLGNRPTFRA